MDKYHFNSLNVRGLQNSDKRRQLFKTLHDKKSDIVFLQETHSTAENQNIWQNEWGGRIFCSHCSSSARGVMILFSKNCNLKVIAVKSDTDGRIISTLINMDNNQDILLTNVYAPNQDDPQFFIELI